MILSILVKSHFGRAGGDGEITFSDMLDAHAVGKGISRSEAYYTLLGYRSDDQLSAEDRFRYRKMYHMGQLKELRKIFKTTSDVSLVKTMRHMGCLSNTELEVAPRDLFKQDKPIVRLLAEWLIGNEERVLKHSKGHMYFKDYLLNYRNLTSIESLKEFMASEELQYALRVSVPEVVYKQGCDLTITQGKLFTPKKYNSKELDKIVGGAIMHALVSHLDISNKAFFYVTKHAIDYHTSIVSDYYLEMIDIAHSLGLSIKELFELCRLNYVDQLELFENNYCTIFAMGEERYEVYGRNSTNPNRYIVLNRKQLNQLGSTGVLKTLDWEGTEPYVYVGRKMPLKQLFMSKNSQDFSVGAL